MKVFFIFLMFFLQEEKLGLFSFILQCSLIVREGTVFMVLCCEDRTSHAAKWELAWKATKKKCEKSCYPTQIMFPKGDLKKTFGHVLHIFIPCISGFLFYFPLIKCLLFLLHLTVMLLSTVASWLDERLEQISQCCFFSVCVVQSQQNLPHCNSVG